MDTSPSVSELRIAWTTLETTESAEQFAQALIESRLAACVQIDGPVRSFFRWEGKIESSDEIRIWIKYPARNESLLQDLVHRIHPYEVPQWISVSASTVGSGYLDWVLRET